MSVSAWSRAVTKMMGVSSERGRCRISCAVSKPSMIGMRTSSSTTANSDRNSWRRASAPDEASTTSSSSGARTVRRAKRLVASSSTMSTPTLVFGLAWMGGVSLAPRTLVTISSSGTG